MKVKNKHGRVGVKTPLSHTQRRQIFLEGFRRGRAQAAHDFKQSVLLAKSLRELKKELGL